MIGLNLTHSRATADATGASVGTTPSTEARHDSAREEGSESEPEEGGAGLRLAAAGAGATGDTVGVEIALRKRQRQMLQTMACGD